MIMKWKSGDLMTKKDEVLKFLEDNSLEAVFVLKDENCRYLSNFTGSETCPKGKYKNCRVRGNYNA